MRILVVGGGAREHAMAWKLSNEAEVIVAPGNPGIADDCEVVPISPRDQLALLNLCKAREVDLVVVGPEDPLIEGLADLLRSGGIAVYGPGVAGARLEGSKAFSKELMQKSGVPTARFVTFVDPKLAIEYAKQRFGAGKQVAVKASGNALGKGVIVASTFEEAADAITQMMIHRQFGSAGETVVIEDRLDGQEFSLLTIVGDHNFVSLPVSQDRKRAFDGDEGPNTGGMGAFSPVDWVSSDLVAETEQKVVKPTLDFIKGMGIDFRGTLFSGLMMDGVEAKCLEFNVRMGDPETEAVMMRLSNGLVDAFFCAATGKFIDPPEVLPNASVTIFVTSEHYPILSSKGSPISFLGLPPNAKLFHAGTTLDEAGNLVTDGGRVIAATAWGDDLGQARKSAYKAASSVRFEGARFRGDIADGGPQ